MRIPLDYPPRVLDSAQPEWPPTLSELNDPPRELLVAGHVPDLSRAIAIVGTRYADPDALAFTHEFAETLARAGCVVVSGGAAGIDAAAHEGALHGGGETVAVLATGLEHAYPAQHGPLFARIAGQGALISEPLGGRVFGNWEFLRRNRLVAALACAVVIVQAPRRSGALSTARWAKSLRRRVLVVPSAPWDRRGVGCMQLLSQGAEICTSPADILSVPPVGAERPRRRHSKQLGKTNDQCELPTAARTLWRWLRKGPSHPDRLAAELDMPVAEVQEALLTLLVQGMCRQRADGAYETLGRDVT
jgi:DNA processing protein